jgi:hypothetical protein
MLYGDIICDYCKNRTAYINETCGQNSAFFRVKIGVVIKSYPIRGLGRPLGLQEVEATRISGQSAHEDGKVVGLAVGVFRFNLNLLRKGFIGEDFFNENKSYIV